MRLLLVGLLASLLPLGASAESRCRAELREQGVSAKASKRRGIKDAVQIRGELGGVRYRSYSNKPLVIDCSLALALARAGEYFRKHGVVEVRYSSAYSRRRVRKSGRWSRHSFGRAIDIHTVKGPSIGALTLRDDYEQGLGDKSNCLGKPLTKGGLVLRALACEFANSGLFSNVLDPDYDAHHYNHFHLDVSE